VHNMSAPAKKPPIPAGEDAEEIRKLRRKLRTEAKTTLEKILMATDGKPITRRGQQLFTSSSGRGPVLTVLIDRKTGEFFYGQNRDEIPPDLHQTLRKLVNKRLGAKKDWEGQVRHIGLPGRHSEIYALNAALLARENNGIPICDLSEFALYNIRTRDYENAKTGEPIIRCANCEAITEGVLDLSY